ncbi:MAG: N-acetyltransferase family protein [Ectothiorhodospiraceae bacterium]|nr:N-acetyltransferase family protein [Ectothiorhodospiraceae bacterium]
MTMTGQDSREVRVRAAAPEDAEAVACIYNHYVKQTVVTFEEEVVSASEITRRIDEVQDASLPWLVAERDDGLLAGYAYATMWRPRRAYRFSVEVTVYVHPDHGARGIGSALYRRLLTELRDGGFHAAMGGIALPNDASVRLHEKFAFKKVAHFEEVGFKFNRWIDVGYWQRLL